MKLTLLLILCSGMILSSRNTQAQNPNDEVKKIIIKKYERMRTTIKAGDPNYVLNMHAKDAILFLPNGKEVVGITALKPFYKNVAATGVDIKSNPNTIELVSKDIVFEVGTVISTSKTGTRNSGKYINIWKKVEGEWKIFKAIDQAKW